LSMSLRHYDFLKPVRFPWIAILGPTAVGKTICSLRLAKRLGGEIVNFDSIQVYRFLNIGSAKPSFKERRLIRHHLIDVLYPDEPFDAADFVGKAYAISKRLERSGKVPIFVGGTGFYLKAFLEGLTPLPKGNQALRDHLRRLEKGSGKGLLFRWLSKFDPLSAKRINPNDLFRIIRALEVFILTGRPFSALCRDSAPHPLERPWIVKIGLARPREELYQRIERRVDEMFEKGLLDEVKGIIRLGYSPDLKSMRSLGYRQAVRVILENVPVDQAIYETKRDTRHYAKRQLTWFKRDPEIRWFHPKALEMAMDPWATIMG